MSGVVVPSRVGLALIGTLAVWLAGCAEQETILPGIREDIRPDQATEESVEAFVNQSRAIRLAAPSVNADWAQGFGTQAFRTANPALRAKPQLIWSTSIGEGDSRRQRITAEPVVGGGRIYTLDSSARVAAVSPSGSLLWSTDLTPARDDARDATGGGLAYAGGRLYVSLGFGQIAALDATSGSVIWRQQLEATGSGQPTIVDGLIYLVAGDETGWAIEADTGRIAWQVDAPPSVANILGAPAPAVTNRFVIFAFGSGELIATFRKGGLQRWSASVAGQRTGRASARISDITGAPVVVGSRVYAGNHSGRLVALNSESGERIWTAREGALGPVWPAGDSIFAITDRRQLVRIDAGNGSLIWAVDLPGFVDDRPRRRGPVVASYGPVMAGGRIVVVSSDGVLRSFAPEDGRLVGTTEIPGGASTPPAIAGNTLYVVNASGDLLAFR